MSVFFLLNIWNFNGDLFHLQEIFFNRFVERFYHLYFSISSLYKIFSYVSSKYEAVYVSNAYLEKCV